MKLELQKWKEDAKKATEGEWIFGSETGNIFSSETNAPYIAQKLFREDGKHIANACPQNFIKLIECYELLIEESVMMDERVEKLEEALKSLKYGCDEKCWCDASIGNPMIRGHSDNCIAITKLLE